MYCPCGKLLSSDCGSEQLGLNIEKKVGTAYSQLRQYNHKLRAPWRRLAVAVAEVEGEGKGVVVLAEGVVMEVQENSAAAGRDASSARLPVYPLSL